MDDERNLHPLTALSGALQAEKIRFMIVGMSAAKEFIGRDKDLAHLPIPRTVLWNLDPHDS